MSNADALAAEITEAAKAYYEGNQIISCEQFDAAVDALREMAPDHPVLSAPGWGYKPEGKLTAKHTIFVGSLPKTHDTNKLKEHDVLSPKYDGISIVAYYEDGRLKQVLTRGDGETGVVVTGRVNVPNKIAAKNITYVKGEALLSYAVFDSELAEEYANPRNAVAGIVNAHDSPHTDKVCFIAYEFGTPDVTFKMDPAGFEHVLNLGGAYGFKTALANPTESFSSFAHPTSNAMLQQLQKWVNECGYPVDGVVHNAIEAIKFPTEDVQTVVTGIDWRLSDKGRLIPVLQVEPVELYGTTVTNVTAYHAQYVQDNKLGAGAQIKITKANEIIPYITEVVQHGVNVIIPTEHNGAPCVWDGVHLTVVDDEARHKKSAIKFIRTLVELDGLGDKVIESILDQTGIKTLPDFLTFLSGLREVKGDERPIFPDVEDATHVVKLGRAMVAQLLDSPIDREKVLFAMNLDGVGTSTSRDLAPHLEEIVENESAGVFLHKIKQNRDKALESINGSVETLKLCLSVLNLTQVVESKPAVLTGKMSAPRKTIVAKLKQLGYHEVKTVTEDCVVIAADPEGSSSKLKKARKLGVEIKTEQEFFG